MNRRVKRHNCYDEAAAQKTKPVVRERDERGAG
jgi:hypothetical protein